MLYRNHNEYHLKHYTKVHSPLNSFGYWTLNKYYYYYYYTGVWNIITIFAYQDQQMRQQTVSAGQISLFRFFHIE